jgi:hypothetical protein
MNGLSENSFSCALKLLKMGAYFRNMTKNLLSPKIANVRLDEHERKV